MRGPRSGDGRLLAIYRPEHLGQRCFPFSQTDGAEKGQWPEMVDVSEAFPRVVLECYGSPMK